MATAVINGVVVSGSVEEIYQLIAKVTTKVNIATSTDNVGITPHIIKDRIKELENKTNEE